MSHSIEHMANPSQSIAEKLNEIGIELVVLGIDFDDLEYGFKEEDKASLKKQNEAILAKLVELCNNGMFATMAEALASLANPTVKSTRPFKGYEGRLGKHTQPSPGVPEPRSLL